MRGRAHSPRDDHPVTRSLASILAPADSVGVKRIAGEDWVACSPSWAHAATERGILEVHQSCEDPEAWQYVVYDALDERAASSTFAFATLDEAASAAVNKSKELFP